MGSRSLTSYCILLHFLLYGVPLWLDVLVGSPSYASHPLFSYAAGDYTTNLVYLAFIAVVPPFWWAIRYRSQQLCSTSNNWLNFPASDRLLLVAKAIVGVLAILPCLLVCFAPDPTLYFHYAVAISPNLAPDEQFFEQFIIVGTVVSALTATFILAQRSRPKWPSSLLLLLLFVDIWLNGKRNIVILIGLTYLINRFQSPSFRGRIALRQILFVLLFTSSFSTLYQFTQREYYQNESVNKYDDFRLDFGRDHTLRTNIYALLYNGPILPAPLHSLKFYATYFIPRSVWPDKPYAYATYFTCYVYLMPAKWIGFSLTTTVLGEAIDNCGWAGMLIGPLLVAVLCQIGARAGLSLSRFLTVIVVNALLVVELAAFLPLAILWVLLLIWDYRLRRKLSGDQVAARSLASAAAPARAFPLIAHP